MPFPPGQLEMTMEPLAPSRKNVEILEIGTPLFKSQGLDAIRRLRAEFP
jgi:3-keto-L-gulonate-6-phosphate decarboxylase